MHLHEAIERARGSELLVESLGGPLRDKLLTAAEAEWTGYHSQVTAWEIDRFL